MLKRQREPLIGGNRGWTYALFLLAYDVEISTSDVSPFSELQLCSVRWHGTCLHLCDGLRDAGIKGRFICNIVLYITLEERSYLFNRGCSIAPRGEKESPLDLKGKYIT